MSLAQWIVDRTLDNPVVFELQQSLFNNYAAVLAEFAGILDRKNICILDVGCSTGTCAGQIIDMEANSYVGIDVSSKYIGIARRRYAKGQFLAMDARHITFANDSFDVAMFVGVLHHMDDRLIRDCLAEVRRVLKPGGRLVVAEPVFTPGNHLSNLFLSLDRGRNIRNEAGYRSLFHGYEIERQRYFQLSLHRFCSYVLSPSRDVEA